MANLSNINNKLIVTDGGNLLVNSTANLATYGGITIDNFSDPSIAMKTTGASGWLWTQYITNTGTNNFSMGVNQTAPYWCVKAGAGMDSPHLVVNSSGNVGIGTISPDFALDIEAVDSGVQLQMGRTNTSAGSTWMGSDSNGFHLGVGAYGAGNSVADPNGFTVLTSGNVGIGTTNATAPLTIAGSGGDGNAMLRLEATAGSQNFNWISSAVYPNLAAGKTAIKLFGQAQGYNNQGYIGFKYAGSGSGDNTLTFGFYANDFLVNLLANGNLGIGTPSPAGLLTIKGTGDAIRVESTNTGAGGAQMDLLHFTTSPADGDTFGMINMGGYYTGTTSVYGTSIKSIWTDVSARNADLTFSTNNSGTLTETIRLTAAGNVGIKFTSPDGYATLTVNGTSSLPILGLRSSSGKVRFGFYEGGTGRFYIDTLNGSDGLALVDGDGVSQRIHINSLGDIGIGTPSPNRKLHVNGKAIIGSTANYSSNSGTLHVYGNNAENSGMLDIMTNGNGRYYTRVCYNATTISQAGYWHIKTNIPVDGGIMFLAKFYGYIYGSAQVLDLQHSGYAYAAGNTVINQGATNNGSNTNASSALYASSNGNKVTFRIAFGAGATFSTYFAGVYMDICFPNPAGRTHDFEIEAQTFNQSGTVY